MSTPDSPSSSPLPEAGNDPGDPNQPDSDLQDSPVAPIADPTNDMDQPDLSDNDSVLSDIDEAQFEDFDPANIAIEDRPAIAVDEDNVGLIGRHKRSREAGDGEVKKKKKEGRREKPKKRKRQEEDDNFSGGEEIDGKRASRRRKAAEDGGERRKPQRREETPEEELDPETRRRRALDRAMDAALKNPNRSRRRRRADGIDVSSAVDEEIAELRDRMAKAAEKDNDARTADPPRPAMHKLKLLPEVTAFLNRNGRDMENAIVDPETNLLQAVRFFLEPLGDGSLPAYNIQRDLFAALGRLSISKDSLISSGLGKVILFYTKSKKLELGIKRQAERLLAEWTRPILKRSDNYRNRMLETREYDPTRLPSRTKNTAQGNTGVLVVTPEERRARELAPPQKSNRARIDATMKSYTIVPRNNVVVGPAQYARPQGASGDDAFRRVKARQMASQGKGPRRG